MINLFISIIVLISCVLVVVVLVQNPKGGGLTQIGDGSANQMMGARAADSVEKLTWYLASAFLACCLLITIFINSGTPATGSSGSVNVDAAKEQINTNPLSSGNDQNNTLMGADDDAAADDDSNLEDPAQ